MEELQLKQIKFSNHNFISNIFKKLILTSLEIAVSIFCSLIIVAAMPGLFAFWIYDWAKRDGGELGDL